MKFSTGKILGLAAFVGSQAIAAPSNDSLAALIDELDQKIRVVERLGEIQKEEAKAAAAKQAKVNAGPGNLGFASADGAFSLRYSGFIQASGRHFTTEPATAQNNAHNFNLRRVQTDIRGTAYKNFGWRVHTNFAPGSNSLSLLDVQFDWNLLPEFNLTAGKFKPPTGLERLLSSPRAPFIEGSFVTVLQPNRDLGIQASGAFAKGVVAYQAGVFNGANDNQDNYGDTDDKYDFYARVFATPFAQGSEALKGFGFGASASYGEREAGTGAANIATLGAIATPGRQSFNPYSADINPYSADTLDGTVVRISPQAYYYYGPFGLIGEYTQTTTAVRNGANSGDLTNSAWALTGSWVITGEKNSYRSGPKVAKANNWPKGSNFGALELLGRVHGISIDDAVAGTYGPAAGVESALSYGAALGWYLNDVFKIYASYEHTDFTNASGANRDAENVLSVSFNVAY
jgi:phosphate-selective porin OprO/OprP